MLIISYAYKQQNLIRYHFARLIIWRSLVQAQAGPQKKNRQWRFFFVIACAFTSWLSPSFMVRSNFVDNEPSVDGSLRDKSQAQAGPQEKNRPNGGSFLFNKPGLSPAGYLLRLRFAPTTLTTNPQSMGLCETNLKPRLVHTEESPKWWFFLCLAQIGH